MFHWLSSTSPRYTLVVLALLTTLHGCANRLWADF